MTHDVEGPHAINGADFIKLHGEPEDVVNGVASHHGEVPYDFIWGILVALRMPSASRPGACSETMTTYSSGSVILRKSFFIRWRKNVTPYRLAAGESAR